MSEITGPIPTGIAICCREWEVALGFSWGKCGLCGKRPVLDREVLEADWPVAK